MPIISLLLKILKSLVSSGLLNDAAIANTQVTIPTPSNTQTILKNEQILLKVERTDMTADGVFGRLSINDVMICETVENKGKEIPEGLYDAIIDLSPRLGYLCPHIRVPIRDQAAGGDAGIRAHKLNCPCQSEGCIGVGTVRDGDAEDNSECAFTKVMALLPKPGVPFKVLVYSCH